MLTKIDPLSALYDEQAEMRPYPKKVVEAVDYLVKISQGKRETVETSKDWGIVAKIFEFWTRFYPNEWDEFGKAVEEIRRTRKNPQGMSDSGEIKYVGALPLRFQKMIKIIFPMQQFDKKFVNKLVDNIKIIRVGKKKDTWFTIPNAPEKRTTTDDIIEKEVKKIGNTK